MRSVILFSIFLFLCGSIVFCNNAGTPVYPAYDFKSFDGGNLFDYKYTFPENYYYLSSNTITPVCSDNDLQIACFLAEWYDNEPYSFIGCSSYSSNFVWSSYIKPSSGRKRVAYNYLKHSLVFWDENGKLVSFNLQTQEYVFNKTLSCDDDDYGLEQTYCLVSTSNLNNGDYFYTCKTGKDETLFAVRNSTSGDVINSLDFYVSQIYDFGSNIAIGLIQFNDGSGGFSLLNPITLDFICNASVADSISLRGFFSNSKYINVASQSPDLYTYTDNCTPLWRMPFNYDISTVAYDFEDNIYLFGYQFYYDFYTSYFDTLVYQIPITEEAPNINELKHVSFNSDYQFAGIDSTSTLFFTNATENELQIFTFSYNSWKNHSKPAYSIEIGIDTYAIIGLIGSGIQVIITGSEFDGILSAQSSSNEWWKITNILSYIFIPITFLFSIIIMIKHIKKGDVKGWHKSKILDILNSILVCFSIIFITITIVVAQVDLISDINDNTVAFSTDLGGFYDDYLQPCGVTTSEDIILCTCDDSDFEYKESSCVASSCPVYQYTCSSYLGTTCDCYHSVYQWDCINCDYLLNGSCTVDLQNEKTYTTLANDQWKNCQNYYDKPTLILNINFYVLVGSAIILVILNIIQIIVLYDIVIFDVILTVSSLFFAFIQFLLILIGSIYISLGEEGDCISMVLNLLPGCILSSNNVINMEILASSYLKNAYLNLFTSPLIFLISAIPDGLSLLLIAFSEIKELYTGYEDIDSSKRKRTLKLFPITCICISIVVMALIFVTAAVLFFISISCSSQTGTCGIDPIILHWFLIIGMIPGSIVSIVGCCILTCIIAAILKK